jgi:hypothetical protein
MPYPFLAIILALLLVPFAVQAEGLPVINIATEGGAGIVSKTEYVRMAFSLDDPLDSANNIVHKIDSSGNIVMADRIRGRGNNTWHSHWARKKSYKIKFKAKTSLFGLEAARSWVLLGQHRDETLLYNATAFELGDRFGARFNHSFNFVDVYINGEYKGNYLLTEHNRVGAGLVDIDKRGGWFAEIDEYYDKRPKFRTAGYDLPIIIRSPVSKKAPDAGNPVYDFVRGDINALADALAGPSFPESGYRELIDMETFAAFLMINEIVANTDLSHPRSVFMYKDKGGLICLGPLWDFDSGFGWHYQNWLGSGFNDHFNYPEKRPPVHAFFKRFYEDPVFLAKYKEMWNAKYDTIASMPAFFDTMAEKLKVSADKNFESWWYKTMAPFTNTRPPMPNDFSGSVAKLKKWYDARVFYLNAEFNKVDAIPGEKDFGAAAAGYSRISPQMLTLVAYGEMEKLSAKLRSGVASAFEVSSKIRQTATGNGGYIAAVSIAPKSNLPAAAYGDTLVLSGVNQGKEFSVAVPLAFSCTVSVVKSGKTAAVPVKKRGWPWSR